MTYLITGATGFVGSKLAGELLANGHAVHYLGRKLNSSLGPRAVFHRWNLQEVPDLGQVPPCDAVIHLAGEPIAQRWTEEIKKRIYSSRVDGTRNLVTALGKVKQPPRVLVTASAVGYYGDRGDEVLREESKAGSNFLAKICVEWEAEACKARVFGMRVSPVRIATVLGRNGGAFPQMATPARFGLGATFGNGKQWMSWIHLQDLIALLQFAAAHTSLDTPLNGSSPEPVTNAAFTQALAHALHRPALFHAPRFALRLLLGEMSSFLFDSLRVVPVDTEQAGFRFQFPNLSTALADLVRR